MVLNTLQNTSLNGACQICYPSLPNRILVCVCVCARARRMCNLPDLPRQICQIPRIEINWYPDPFLHPFPCPPIFIFSIFQSLPFQLSCSCLHIMSLMLILLLLPPGIPAPLPFPLECECELPGAGLTDPLCCMGVGAKWPGFCWRGGN